ncbi:MAG: TonB-dependent receptor [Acidobacteriota bacterium]
MGGQIRITLLWAVILCLSTPIFSLAGEYEGTGISGVVRDTNNVTIKGATISLFPSVPAGNQVLAGSAVTDQNGQFNIEKLPPGNYEIIVQHPDFKLFRDAVRIVDNEQPRFLEIALTATDTSAGFTVTAVIKEEQEEFESSQQVKSVAATDLKRVSGVILPQLLQEEVGIHIQQNTPGVGAISIRGLTGQQVVTLIDGLRFSNSIAQPGPDQLVGLIEPNIARRIDLIYGPGSAVYGSDALGGTVNVITEKPKFFSNGLEFHGQLGAFFSSADLSIGSDFKLNLGNRKASLIVSGFGRRIDELRTGQELDSHATVTRLFGLSSKLFSDHLNNTDYRHFGGFAKFLWNFAPTQQLSVFYNHSEERDINRYDLVGGGPGAIRARFSPQKFDFFYLRYEKQNLGLFDTLSTNFSYNRQRNDFQIQFTRGSSPTREMRSADAFGYGFQATTHIGSYQFLTFGGELYDEYIDNIRFSPTPMNPAGIATRGSFPNGSRYQSYGIYVQDTTDVIPGKLRLNGGARYSAFFFKSFAQANPLNSQGRPTVPNSSVRVDDVTFNLEAIGFINQNLSVVGSISRGFRAPNVIDLGSLGNSTFGVEVLANEAVALGGMIGTTISAQARSTGKRVSLLKPENLLNYEVSVRFQNRRVYTAFTFFDAELSNFITKRALVLPPGATGKTIAGEVITSQSPTGVPMIRTLPVIVSVNLGEVRLYGFETSTRIKLRDSLTLSGNLSYLRGIDKNPRKALPSVPGLITGLRALDVPDITGGLPPAKGLLSLRYESPSKKYWLEAYSHLASYQDRYSALDLADTRIGASRSRGTIAFFFFSGARELGLIGNGADGRPSTPDDVLLATGETLTQVQDRVLGKGVISRPLTNRTPGYATFNLRGGFSLGERSNITIILENIFDKNYRQHGSGIDAPGINLTVRYSWHF